MKPHGPGLLSRKAKRNVPRNLDRASSACSDGCLFRVVGWTALLWGAVFGRRSNLLTSARTRGARACSQAESSLEKRDSRRPVRNRRSTSFPFAAARRPPHELWQSDDYFLESRAWGARWLVWELGGAILTLPIRLVLLSNKLTPRCFHC